MSLNLNFMSMNRSARGWLRSILWVVTLGLLVGAPCAFARQADDSASNASGKAQGTALQTPSENSPRFIAAQPVWPEGRETEKNITVGFRAGFEVPAGKKVLLRATGATLYRIFLNGEFIGHGPARGPHGWYRVDELDLSAKVKPGKNVVTFEVAGYNVNSFYLLDQPSFLQAEVVAEGQVLAATGKEGKSFEAGLLPERVQKVQRYSFQRPFSEVYRLAPGYDRWRKDLTVALTSAKCVPVSEKAFLPRRVPYCEFTRHTPKEVVSEGELKTGLKVDNPWKDRSLTGIGPQLGGFPEAELACIPTIELQGVGNATTQAVNQPYATDAPLTLKAGSYQILDFGVNSTGFLGARITCRNKTRLFFTFDEILSNGDVDFKRLSCVNIVEWELQPGAYDLEAFEPYTLRYLKLLALEGDCEVSGLYLRDYVSPIPADARFQASDKRLNQLFAAGVETFRQNAVDVFMDCPSRERAGWLCDSFFTSRVAQDLTGQALIEQNLFENYRLPGKFAYLPEGMLPMCYPSDHNDGVFIPNWAMWFVVELEEYLARSGDRETVKALEPRLMQLLDYFKRFRNEDGLLEKLNSWVFVEWSKANDFVQDVNYPSNMLYAEVLAAMGRMYGRSDLTAEAEKIRDVIRKQSFDGEFFVDNAVRRDGKLEVTQNHSEVCQYFAFFFHTATPETHPQLWQTLVKDFGPQRKQTKAFPEVHPANAFVGNVLRLELLSRAGLSQQLLDESLAYQLYMADRTGTLWENDTAYASCNHGFASHGSVRILYRDVLGIASLDTVNKVVQLRFTDLTLDRCEGSLPTPDGKVELRWRREGGKLYYRIEAPSGYTVKVENRSKQELVKES
jgi:alpha-L-rhamnosidase